MKKIILALLLSGGLLAASSVLVSAQEQEKQEKPKTEMSLITATPEEGFQLAVTLSRKGVTTIQKDKKVLVEGREEYSKDADSLIAASQVIAIHFQTVAAANNYWRDNNNNNNNNNNKPSATHRH